MKMKVLQCIVFIYLVIICSLTVVSAGPVDPGWEAVDGAAFDSATSGIGSAYIRSETGVQNGTLQYDVVEAYFTADDGYIYVGVVRDGAWTGSYRYPSSQGLPSQNEENWWDDWLGGGYLGTGDPSMEYDWWNDYVDWSDGGDNGGGDGGGGDNGGGHNFYTPLPASFWLFFTAVGALGVFRRRFAER